MIAAIVSAVRTALLDWTTPVQDADALKPCPWCGGTNIRERNVHIGPYDKYWEIACQTRDCPSMVRGPVIQWLREKWNTRPGEGQGTRAGKP